MSIHRPLFTTVALLLGLACAEAGEGAGRHAFGDGLWAKLGAKSCLKCHQAGGDAEDSDFILTDPSREAAPGGALQQNEEAFTRMAKVKEPDGRYRILLKAVGELKHGGEAVLQTDSTRYRLLERFVRQMNGEPVVPSADPSAAPGMDQPFMASVTLLSPHRLWRRLALQLGARLPADAELTLIKEKGASAIAPLMDTLMQENAFYQRLEEGFNDIFLTPGIDDVAENVLSYEHFEKTRHWYQHWEFPDIKDAKEKERAGWRLADDYREAIKGEPMALISHIVRHDRPFTEIITADYIMVTPHSARGYGIYDDIKSQFKNPQNHMEYIPVRLKALKGRNKENDQESATGFYPHAGLLSTFQYLKRYPTTETNRNRLRVRLYFQQFLGTDIMQIAPRVNDAAAATAKYKVPVMEAADCVVCHRIIDPLAGVFQDYYALDGEGVYRRRKEGWFTDMFPPGRDGESLPPDQRWRALQWLGERTINDPRFAVAMVEHVLYILTGRKTLLAPGDIDDPLFSARQRAWREQRQEIERIARDFAATGFNLKSVFKAWAASPFYRADAPGTLQNEPHRAAELADLGVTRLLAPEQLERKLHAIFGRDWGPLKDKEAFLILYGGIDLQEITERIAEPSGAMGAIQRMMANEMACQTVASDFAQEPARRRLFPKIEPHHVPNAENEPTLRAAITHLHHHLLGRDDTPDSAEVTRSYDLFKNIITDAQAQPQAQEKTDIYHCRPNQVGDRIPDPDYTIRAWRAVVTYLLRQQDFLYE